ncbi:unnamed protein product [Polarella glacialis]|uniref:Uncharacterized protein n=1 Tax=Polarella glacialis TaxID=89957 RepID=A0A813DRK5_POLGL|nr:unnamed protein product [Polarella glacialis]
MSEKDVMKAAKWSRRAAMGKCVSSGDAAADKELWENTVLERDKGWLSGPFSEEELSSRLGPLWTASSRFPVRQGDKLRCIDNLSGSFVNAAFGSSEKLDLGGIDQLAGLVKALIGGVLDNRDVVLTLSTGVVLRGVLRCSFSIQEARDICGRTLDLESAYRQLFTASCSAWASVIVVFCPESGKPELFCLEALPFGATAAVYGFNRMARAIWFIGVTMLGLLWTNFYDDFPHVDHVVSSSESHQSSLELLELLGWSVSKSAKKDKPMAKSFVVLGVVFDLSSSAAGYFEVLNKPDRIEAICEIVRRFREARTFSPHEAASLRGRFQFAEAQLFARMSLLALRPISERAHSQALSFITDEIDSAFSWLCEVLCSAVPRRVVCVGSLPPLLVLTDGACEGVCFELVTCGGVMFDPVDGALEFFGFEVEPRILSEWTRDGPRQTIGQAELYPVLIAKRFWANRMRYRRVFFFIDNDSARDALIKCGSTSVHSRAILKACADCESLCCTYPWYARVASESNLGDDPSRLDFKVFESFPRACQVHPVQPCSLEV